MFFVMFAIIFAGPSYFVQTCGPETVHQVANIYLKIAQPENTCL